MKKMQKILAMTLALVMMMGLLTVGAGAVSAATVCGYHQHDENACYGPDFENPVCEEEPVLSCEKHVHTEECYHQHTEECAGYACGQDACAEEGDHPHGDGCHVHTEECAGYICGLEEGAKTCAEEDHEHSEENECYAPHKHDDTCYAKKLICNAVKVHAHEAACYPGNIVLGDSALISKDKYAAWADQDAGIADVTLEIGGKKHSSIDVVIIMGDSMPGYTEVVGEMIKLFKPILEDSDPNTNIKLGMVPLGREGYDVLDVNSEGAKLSNVETDPNYYETVLANAAATAAAMPEGTTNLEGALRVAEEMLARDTAVAAEDKYVYVMSTGRTYWFNDTDDANGKNAMVVHEKSGGYYWGDYQWKQDRGRHTSLYMIPDTYKNSYADFFEDIKKWVAADGDKYVYRLPEGKTYLEWRDGGDNTSRKPISPAPTAANSVTGVMAGVPMGNPAYKTQHALNYERAQYEAAKAYADLQAAGYHCYAICSEGPSYQNNSPYYQAKKNANVANTQIQVGHAFMDYLAQMSGQEYAPCTWNAVSAELQPGFFAPIKEHIIHALSAGSKVEDVIGYGSDYNFDFVVDGKITLTVGATAYTAAKLETAKEGFDASYTFTAPGATTATFELDYVKGDGLGGEKFIWSIGETVTILEPAALTYQVQLAEKQEEAGTYLVNTNVSATLYPVDSDQNPGTPELFPVPTLEYTVEEPNLDPDPTPDPDPDPTPDPDPDPDPDPQPQPEPQPTPDDTIILDEDVPLADVPATGDPLTLMAAVSLLSGAGVYFTRKREDEE